MTPEEFLHSVYERPDDDAPRLAYARWLDSQSDPRGEFIRLQCSRGPGGRRSAREKELEATHRRAWLGECFQNWYPGGTARFERGFVTAFTPDSLSLKRDHPTGFDALATVEELDASMTDAFGHLPWLLSLPQLRVVRSLKRVGSLDAVIASPWAERLERLSDCWQVTSTPDVVALRKLSALRSFSSAYGFSAADVTLVLDALPRLDCFGCPIDMSSLPSLVTEMTRRRPLARMLATGWLGSEIEITAALTRGTRGISMALKLSKGACESHTAELRKALAEVPEASLVGFTLKGLDGELRAALEAEIKPALAPG